MPRLGSAPLQSYLRFFIFVVPKNRSTLRGGGHVGGMVGWVTVSLRGLRYSEKACNFPQFRREFAHTSPTRTRQPPIGARRLTQTTRYRAHSISRKAEHFSEFSISLSLSLSLSLSRALSLSLENPSNPRSPLRRLERARAMVPWAPPTLTMGG